MYPYEIVFGLTLYDIFIAVGIIMCLVVFRKVADKMNIAAKLQNFVLVNALVAIAGGYGSAVLAQALYNIKNNGSFEITQTTGATFFGGLIGGALTFIIVYFIVGHFLFRDNYHVKVFIKISDAAACSITVAHAFGRLGCLMAGCCHGKPTDAWYGIYMVDLGYKVVPVQLFEALVLFALCSVLVLMIYHKKKYCMPLYMVAYGVWRFLIEYARGDERGNTVVSFLSPSQLTALVLIAGGIILFCIEFYFYKAKQKQTEN